MSPPTLQLLRCLYLLLVLLHLAAASPPPSLLDHYTILGTPFPSPPLIVDPTLDGLPPLDDETPTCSIPILTFNLSSTSPSHFFSNYTPPDSDECPWTTASLEISASAEVAGSFDRIAALWVDGVELLRSSTPVPTQAGVLWKVRKDVTRYSAVLSRGGVACMAVVSPTADDAAIFNINATLHFHAEPHLRSIVDGTPEVKSLPEKLRILYATPADEIIPLSPPQPEEPCFWHRIGDGSDRLTKAMSIPNNTRRAVLELLVSAHVDDEFWYSNLPNFFYNKHKSLQGRRGNGPIRQLTVTVDDLLVGSVVPFPMVYSGGVNPLLWTPIAPVGSFVLPSQDIELTPVLGRLLDGELHQLGIRIWGALPFWLVGANLHLWLDPNATVVTARMTKYKSPKFSFSSNTKSWGSSHWQFQAEREGEFSMSGWVASSLGNLTTHVKAGIDVSAEISFRSNGSVEEVEFEAENEREVQVEEGAQNVIAKMKEKVKFPAKMSVAVVPAGRGMYRLDAKVSRGVEEEVEVEHDWVKRQNKVKNKNEGKGWMVVDKEEGAVVTGGTYVEHKYSSKGSKGCYERKVKVVDGNVWEDEDCTQCNLCSSSM